MNKQNDDTVYIKITSCSQCSECDKTRTPTADSFEMAFDWFCKAAMKKIAGYVCWNDKDPKIPEWCPKRSSK